MYVRPISARLFGGRSTHATRAIYLISDCGFQNAECKNNCSSYSKSKRAFRLLLFLSLFMLGVAANNAHHAFAVNDLALITNFSYRRPDFHFLLVAIRYPPAVQIIR